MISLHLQFHLHHANWIGEIQELVVMPKVRSSGIGSQLLGVGGRDSTGPRRGDDGIIDQHPTR
ncbi:aminoalkylphosphonic acid N-acetyltransferase [Kluyvera cryocrescens]|uniref:Aminoalkylphosphonic acid N-acetyltransferase n=1 Tax=Kluyvera cryocrescens TaxID=580 RepID=A0A485AIJ2_KLUCR|nr:aminoalkylphosphonic acid N-acetyltransferase [Kluyvera cryocrescens]